MNVPFVDLKRQYVALQDELRRAMESVCAGASFILGPQLEDFERNFADYVGAPHCVGVGNGGDALYLALRALGLGPQDEVIAPANTFVATLDGIARTGARPVLVDCHPDTYLIDARLAEAAVTLRTRAILPVHLYGHPVDVPRLLEIAAQHELIVVEDAAQAHGATWDGRPCGSFGAAACWSFYPGKNLGAYGDGGAVTVHASYLADELRKLRNYGSLQKYHHELVGVNSRLDTLQAAVLDVKLKHMAVWNEARRTHAHAYTKGLRGAAGVTTPYEDPRAQHVYHLYVVEVEDRAGLQRYLSEQGVQTGIHYPIPAYRLASYQYLGYSGRDFPVAEAASQRILSLPMFPEMTVEERDFVIESILEWSGSG